MTFWACEPSFFSFCTRYVMVLLFQCSHYWLLGKGCKELGLEAWGGRCRRVKEGGGGIGLGYVIYGSRKLTVSSELGSFFHVRIFVYFIETALVSKNFSTLKMSCLSLRQTSLLPPRVPRIRFIYNDPFPHTYSVSRSSIRRPGESRLTKKDAFAARMYGKRSYGL